VASSWAKAGRLQGGGLVATVMSNLGLERFLDGLGLKLVRTKVGDRYVVEEMRRVGYNVGGEQSGHIIMSDYTTTGDGLIAALQFLAVVIQSGQSASAVGRVFTPLPQILKNVRFGRNGKTPLEHATVLATIADAERRLGTHGRLVIRKSGTEPVIRVMAEGEDDAMVLGIVDEIAAAITRAAS
jgi:phosphoglucosamine mutase